MATRKPAAKKAAPKKTAPKKIIPITPLCFNCKFSLHYESVYGEESLATTELYLCRRNPPSPMSEGAEYPVVGADFWCGEHRFGEPSSPYNA